MLFDVRLDWNTSGTSKKLNRYLSCIPAPLCCHETLWLDHNRESASSIKTMLLHSNCFLCRDVHEFVFHSVSLSKYCANEKIFSSRWREQTASLLITGILRLWCYTYICFSRALVCFCFFRCFLSKALFVTVSSFTNSNSNSFPPNILVDLSYQYAS